MRLKHKVVLYNPKAVFYTMPLALLAIGSNLDPKRYEVRVIDGRLEHDPATAVLAKIDDALCLGVSVLTGAPIRDALRITRAAKIRRPDLPVVWGGWHPSLFATETLDEPGIDITVQAQGEETFRELVDRLAEGADLHGLPGIAYRTGGQVIQNPPRPLVDMNDLPPHHYALLPVERYFTLKKKRQLDYISSTGCFWRCAFCADPFVYKRGWVALGPERMGDDIERLWRRYGFDELAFQDETFFTYSRRVVAIAEAFLRRGLRFGWTATMRADQGFRLSDDVFDMLTRSGLRRVLIGVESGSQDMLDWMQKDSTIDQVLDCAEKCVRHRVGAIFPFIVGFPGETDASVRASVALAKRLRSMSPRFETPIFYFKPYPGSQITTAVVRDGYTLPHTLEEWAAFDFVGSSGPWVSPEKFEFIERFKFYNRAAWGRRTWVRWPLQQLARWRCKRDFYRLPVEKLAVERLMPAPRLS
ncbi:MAG: B12-binding domain-containing radical SAM protein [Rhodothermales bacterium]